MIEGRSAYYLSINRNKLGLAADLDARPTALLLERLIADADVVVDNFRPATLERRGISPDDWCARRPELVWCTITGFGADVDRPGYDFVAQAECGWMAITGEPDGDPMKVGVALADVLAGKDAAIAILARARSARLRTGVGGRVVDLARRQRASRAGERRRRTRSSPGRDAVRWGNAHPNLVPYQLFHAADRPIVVAVGSDAQWVACARALGLADLADDPSLATNAGRLAQRDRIVDAFSIAACRRSRRRVARTRSTRRVCRTASCKSVLEALQETNASAVTGMPSSVGGEVRFRRRDSTSMGDRRMGPFRKPDGRSIRTAVT